MDTYILRIKELASNFSYQQFIILLKNLDDDIINNNIQYLNPEFIHYFKQIISMVNDRYIVDDKPGTLGHMLVEIALLNKTRLTPTLLMCFILEQKQSIGLDGVCNELVFSNLNKYKCRMMITNYHDSDRSTFSINMSYYLNNNKDNVDKYNYDIMFDILHELTHVYQLTREEQTENIFDKLTYYDYKKDCILINNGGNNSNMFFHQSLLSEFMADEQAYAFMLKLSQRHPEYFNDNLIQKKLYEYQCRKNGTYGDYGSNPREAFNELISDFKNMYEKYPNEQSISFLKPMLDEIEELNKKSQPLISELQLQGISEKERDSYYSIYFNSLYKFDGNNIVLNNELNKKVSK